MCWQIPIPFTPTSCSTSEVVAFSHRSSKLVIQGRHLSNLQNHCKSRFCMENTVCREHPSPQFCRRLRSMQTIILLQRCSLQASRRLMIDTGQSHTSGYVWCGQDQSIMIGVRGGWRFQYRHLPLTLEHQSSDIVCCVRGRQSSSYIFQTMLHEQSRGYNQ